MHFVMTLIMIITKSFEEVDDTYTRVNNPKFAIRSGSWIYLLEQSDLKFKMSEDILPPIFSLGHLLTF